MTSLNGSTLVYVSILTMNECQMGVIVGTGTNACYMEKIERCEKLNGVVDVNDRLPDEVRASC